MYRDRLKGVYKMKRLLIYTCIEILSGDLLITMAIGWATLVIKKKSLNNIYLVLYQNRRKIDMEVL